MLQIRLIELSLKKKNIFRNPEVIEINTSLYSLKKKKRKYRGAIQKKKKKGYMLMSPNVLAQKRKTIRNPEASSQMELLTKRVIVNGEVRAIKKALSNSGPSF